MSIEERMKLEEILGTYPDKVSLALQEWRKATLERETKEATLYLKFKGEDGKHTQDEIKARVRADDERYALVLIELEKEGQYVAFNETLLAAKREAALRTAY